MIAVSLIVMVIIKRRSDIFRDVATYINTHDIDSKCFTPRKNLPSLLTDVGRGPGASLSCSPSHSTHCNVSSDKVSVSVSLVQS